MTARIRDTLNRLLIGFCMALAVAALAGLLRASRAAFSWQNFHFLDYGGYTNMLWNTAHGRPFTVLVDMSYLQAHLSFSLALLAPLFRLWDHPFLLAATQWACLVAGVAIVWRIGVRSGLPAGLRAALVLFFVGYPFTQSVTLSEFHGVGVYVLLLPWLYYALRFRPTTAWVPLALTLGVREDAFLIVFPIVLILAVRRKSRLLYGLAAASLIYGLAAVFVLYPLINGASLFSFRANWFPSGGGGLAPNAEAVTVRLKAVGWVLLPVSALLFAKRRCAWGALAGFVAVPLIVALISTSPHQYGLRVHYPAAVMVCLTLGLIEALAFGRNKAKVTPVLAALVLVAATLFAHVVAGFLPGGGQHQRVYGRVHPEGARVLELARGLPQEGVLLCSEQLAVFCANRADLLVPQFYDPARHRVDVLFFSVRDLTGRVAETVAARLRRRDFGVLVSDGDYLILARGADSARNAEALRTMAPTGTETPPASSGGSE